MVAPLPTHNMNMAHGFSCFDKLLYIFTYHLHKNSYRWWLLTPKTKNETSIIWMISKFKIFFFFLKINFTVKSVGRRQVAGKNQSVEEKLHEKKKGTASSCETCRISCTFGSSLSIISHHFSFSIESLLTKFESVSCLINASSPYYLFLSLSESLKIKYTWNCH